MQRLAERRIKERLSLLEDEEPDQSCLDEEGDNRRRPTQSPGSASQPVSMTQGHSPISLSKPKYPKLQCTYVTIRRSNSSLIQIFPRFFSCLFLALSSPCGMSGNSYSPTLKCSCFQFFLRGGTYAALTQSECELCSCSVGTPGLSVACFSLYSGL